MERFAATVTLNQSGSFDHCGIGFEVIADGKSIWKSKPINRDHRSELCDVGIPGCRELELRTFTVTATFGGHAVWIEPRISTGEDSSSRDPVEPKESKLGPPSDAVVWEKNGHAYKVFKERLRWPEAKQRCEELGGHLVSITDGNFLNICPHIQGGWNDDHAVGAFVTGFICEWPKRLASSKPKPTQPAAESKQAPGYGNLFAGR